MQICWRRTVAASGLIGLVQPRTAVAAHGWRRFCPGLCAYVRLLEGTCCATGGGMSIPESELSDEQSRQVADLIREEIARRRISRQALAEQAKLSLSTLEKALGGRRPFTLATIVRLEQALGVSLRKAPSALVAAPVGNGDVAPDSLGAYARRAVSWIEGT